ncbi:hypothetical protein OS175_13620 [Marinicella sp. S1101]|uniref:hypothetical protein n=1 Tax=Marinicella marina TaxID=2996016 RepID=UPI0022609A9A|nr:hypothetical protein [Marinicella marina]MCX7554913.1 hypothetical protein [Marinicella marina]MDJ1141263.1 hypothetical protein [Marinicella marina]
MDALPFYSEYLSLFMSLIVAGTGLKLALQQQSNKTYRIGEKEINRQKAHTAAMLVLMGGVIQTVSDTMQMLDGRTLLLDEKILAAYVFSLAVMVMKK